jgi:hypothetical protein
MLIVACGRTHGARALQLRSRRPGLEPVPLLTRWRNRSFTAGFPARSGLARPMRPSVDRGSVPKPIGSGGAHGVNEGYRLPPPMSQWGVATAWLPALAACGVRLRRRTLVPACSRLAVGGYSRSSTGTCPFFEARDVTRGPIDTHGVHCLLRQGPARTPSRDELAWFCTKGHHHSCPTYRRWSQTGGE